MFKDDNQKGIVLLELLAAFSLILLILFTLIPILVQINIERNILQERREIQSTLHNELQLHTPESYNNKVIEVNHTNVTLVFESTTPLLKGSAHWTNVRGKQEEIILYYYPSFQKQ
ncbi:type II secretory pathway pseudopilin PulG [Natronobacillus azotifigens]|uniref:Uncharacterized protein n=1 Tax=Natronobacillus azotifigens TaxID=472978 RepID=A0A9J6RE96_9BACI|nr:hypothetical protein [Natronobacillus azotifigens]MCZ0704066.1 hypothetical protein [Natronobacillus azotifigens]